MAMLFSLFGQHSGEQEKDSDFEDDFDLAEKRFPNGKPGEEWVDFAYVLDNVKLVKNSFGKDYLKLEPPMEVYLWTLRFRGNLTVEKREAVGYLAKEEGLSIMLFLYF